jgi:hypothetical protein
MEPEGSVSHSQVPATCPCPCPKSDQPNLCPPSHIWRNWQPGSLGSARLGSARLGSARLSSAWLGSARLGSARLAWLGSARLGLAWLGETVERNKIKPPLEFTVILPCSGSWPPFPHPLGSEGHILLLLLTLTWKITAENCINICCLLFCRFGWLVAEQSIFGS